jgi:hypothetical protein
VVQAAEDGLLLALQMELVCQDKEIQALAMVVQATVAVVVQAVQQQMDLELAALVGQFLLQEQQSLMQLVVMVVLLRVL